MERLNDIINRTAQRRQQNGNQQEPEPRVQQGQQGQRTNQGQQHQQHQQHQQRQQRPEQPPARRSLPLPEQTARLGQQGPPTRQLQSQPAQPSQHSQPTRKYYQHIPRNRALSEPDYPQSSRYPQREMHEPYARNTPNMPNTPYAPDEANVTRPLYGYEQGPRRNDAGTDNAGSTGYYRTPRGIVQATPPADDYYDAYAAMPSMPPAPSVSPVPPVSQADVQAEWEDDAAVMRFGDWEVDGDDRQHYPDYQDYQNYPDYPDYSSASREMLPTQRRDREIREIESQSRGVPYSPVTRNLQAMHTPVPPSRLPVSSTLPTLSTPPMPAPPALPAPQPAPQEMRPHRHTQPLDPQTVVNMAREMPLERGRQPQPARIPDGQAQTTGMAITSSTSTPARIVCPICKGAGFLRANVPVGDPNFGKPVACACKEAERREKRRQQLLELSDLSAFQHSSFSNFHCFPGISPSVKEAYKHARQFAQSPHGWLVLIGPNGCGKTHLAAAIANQILKEGAVVLFTVVPDLLAHLRSTFGNNATEAYDQRFAKMREAELLVLDDLGAHQSSPWASEKLFQLLNYRYNSSFPTVITANQHGLMGLDERIISRMSDTALVTRITMAGAIDYRPRNTRQ